MAFVFTMVSVDVILLIMYTLLEAFVDKFGVNSVPNKEKEFTISGVSEL